MGDNLIINDAKVKKVITVLKYVTLTFSGINPLQSLNAVPGEQIIPPFIGAQLGETLDTTIEYNLLYNWIYLDVPMPLLVPTKDATYEAEWCLIKVPKATLEIVCSSYGTQNQVGNYIINSEYPLYIRAETWEGSILRNVSVKNNINVAVDSTYNQYLTFDINGVSVIPGTQKNFII